MLASILLYFVHNVPSLCLKTVYHTINTLDDPYIEIIYQRFYLDLYSCIISDLSGLLTSIYDINTAVALTQGKQKDGGSSGMRSWEIPS